MTLRDDFRKSLNNAVRSKDEIASSTMRLIIAAVKDLDISQRSHRDNSDFSEGITDNEIIALLRKMVKQRLESAAIYDREKRPELADRELKEKEIIEHFLPKMMSDEAMEKVILAKIKECKAENLRDLGKVIAKIKESHPNDISLNKAAMVVREILKQH